MSVNNPQVILVVAMNKSRVIGVEGNKLPWHIAEDLAHFKQVTMGMPIIMGRKTFASIGRVLPGRKNIVLSNNAQFIHPEVTVCKSLSEAFIACGNVPELAIIGGGEIFQQAIDLASKVHLTVVDLEVKDATAFFPEMNQEDWHIVNEETIVSKGGVHCCFREYRRN